LDSDSVHSRISRHGAEGAFNSIYWIHEDIMNQVKAIEEYCLSIPFIGFPKATGETDMLGKKIDNFQFHLLDSHNFALLFHKRVKRNFQFHLLDS